ncbi:MAG: hypothetical protein ACJ73E_18565 [Mycobacteriales bacterium]
MSQELGRDRVIPDPHPAPAGGGWSAPDPDRQAPPWASPAELPASMAPQATVGPAAGEPVYRPTDGGIPLRPLGVGDLLDGTFTTIRRNPRATIGLAAVLITLQQGLVVGAQLLTGDIPTLTGFAGDTFSLELLGGFGGLIGTLLSAVVGAVLTGMLVVVVSEDVLGRRVTVGQVWTRVRPRLWALLAASAVAGLLPYVGLLLLIIPGVILWGAWALTTPALVLEGLGPLRALRRSWQLAWPAFPRIWSIRTLSELLATLMQYLVAVPFAMAGALVALALGADEGSQLPVVALVLVVLGGIAAGTLTAPFLAGVLALLYVDRRMRAEGLDLVLQRQARLGGPAGPRPPTMPAPASGGGP